MPTIAKKGAIKKPAASKVASKKMTVVKSVAKPVAKAKETVATKVIKATKTVVAKAKSSTKTSKPTEKKIIKATKVSKPAKKMTAVAKPKSVIKKEIVTKVTKPERSKVGKSMKATKTNTKLNMQQATIVAHTHQKEAMTKPIATDFSNLSFLGITPYQEKSGEEYMNDIQLKHFQNILMAWKVALMEEVDRTLHHMQDEAANYPDPNDRASQEEEFSLELRARDRERKLTRKIDEALKRITDKEYGFCDACGIEIGIRRLEARPTATLCIDCKTLDEIREKHIVS